MNITNLFFHLIFSWVNHLYNVRLKAFVHSFNFHVHCKHVLSHSILLDFKIWFNSLDDSVDLVFVFRGVFRVGRKNKHIKLFTFRVNVFKHILTFSVKLSSLFVIRFHLLFHYIVVRITNKGNNKVEKNHKNKPLIHKPNYPDKLNCNIYPHSIFVFPNWKGWSINIAYRVLIDLKEISSN